MKKIVATLLALVMVFTAVPCFTNMTSEAAESTGAKSGTVLFDNNFDDENLAGLSDAALAEAIFGAGNYRLNQGGNTTNAKLGIENGSLRITSGSDCAAQFLVASNSEIAERGVIVECDYTMHDNMGGYIGFASKPIAQSGGVDNNNAWLAGVWANGYRAVLRNSTIAWNGGIVKQSDWTYSQRGTTYNLKVEVTPTDGIILSAKQAGATAYDTIAHVTTDMMDGYSKSYSGVSFEAFRDGNVRLITYDGCDITIDNLKVYSPASPERVIGNTVTLDGSIGVNYYVQREENENMSMEFTMADGTVQTVTESTYNAEKDAYVYTCNLPAKNMTDEISAKLFLDGECVGEYNEFSVKEYANELLGRNDLDVKMKTLVENMLHYGAKAQIYFAYNTNDLANAGLSLDLSDVTQATFNTYGNLSKTVGDFGTIVGSNLNLKTETTLNVYIKPNAGVNATDYTFKCENATLTRGTHGD